MTRRRERTRLGNVGAEKFPRSSTSTSGMQRKPKIGGAVAEVIEEVEMCKGSSKSCCRNRCGVVKIEERSATGGFIYCSFVATLLPHVLERTDLDDFSR
jgi:hypothetical protein